MFHYCEIHYSKHAKYNGKCSVKAILKKGLSRNNEDRRAQQCALILKCVGLIHYKMLIYKI